MPRLLARLAGPLLSTVALLAPAGCGLIGGDDAPTATTAAATTTTAPATTTTVVPAQPPQLLDAGAEPRRTLRLAYTEGDRAEVSFTSDLAITQTVDGDQQRLDTPPIAQTLAYTVGTVSPEGAELTIRIADLQVKAKGTGLTDAQVKDLEDQLRPLVGLEAHAVATPTGELQDLAFDLPDDLPDATAARLDALEDELASVGPTLPTEAVGIGARWRSTTTRATSGADLETTTTVTLTALEGDTVAYTASSTSTAAPQPTSVDGLEPGQTARLESADLRGRTTGSLRLDAVGYDLRTTVSGTQRLTLTAAGADTALTQQIELAYVARTGAG